MSPQQTMKKRHEMIQETQEFLDQELNSPQAVSECYPRMQFRPSALDTLRRRSFVPLNHDVQCSYPRN